MTAGIVLCSWTVDSGYMPFSGLICRSCGSLVGCIRFWALVVAREK